MLPDTSGCVGDHRLLGQHLAGPLGALVRLGQDGVERRRHALDAARGRAGVAQGREGGGRGRRMERRAGTAPAAPRRSPAAAERLVSGVPPAPSAGGAGGLPDLPREGRGRGVVSGQRLWCRAGPDLGGRGMGEIYGAGRGGGQLVNDRHQTPSDGRCCLPARIASAPTIGRLPPEHCHMPAKLPCGSIVIENFGCTLGVKFEITPSKM